MRVFKYINNIANGFVNIAGTDLSRSYTEKSLKKLLDLRYLWSLFLHVIDDLKTCYLNIVPLNYVNKGRSLVNLPLWLVCRLTIFSSYPIIKPLLLWPIHQRRRKSFLILNVHRRISLRSKTTYKKRVRKQITWKSSAVNQKHIRRCVNGELIYLYLSK